MRESNEDDVSMCQKKLDAIDRLLTKLHGKYIGSQRNLVDHSLSYDTFFGRYYIALMGEHQEGDFKGVQETLDKKLASYFNIPNQKLIYGFFWTHLPDDISNFEQQKKMEETKHLAKRYLYPEKKTPLNEQRVERTPEQMQAIVNAMDKQLKKLHGKEYNQRKLIDHRCYVIKNSGVFIVRLLVEPIDNYGHINTLEHEIKKLIKSYFNIDINTSTMRTTNTIDMQDWDFVVEQHLDQGVLSWMIIPNTTEPLNEQNQSKQVWLIALKKMMDTKVEVNAWRTNDDGTVDEHRVINTSPSEIVLATEHGQPQIYINFYFPFIEKMHFDDFSLVYNERDEVHKFSYILKYIGATNAKLMFCHRDMNWIKRIKNRKDDTFIYYPDGTTWGSLPA